MAAMPRTPSNMRASWCAVACASRWRGRTRRSNENLRQLRIEHRRSDGELCASEFFGTHARGMHGGDPVSGRMGEYVSRVGEDKGAQVTAVEEERRWFAPKVRFTSPRRRAYYVRYAVIERGLLRSASEEIAETESAVRAQLDCNGKIETASGTTVETIYDIMNWGTSLTYPRDPMTSYGTYSPEAQERRYARELERRLKRRGVIPRNEIAEIAAPLTIVQRTIAVKQHPFFRFFKTEARLKWLVDAQQEIMAKADEEGRLLSEDELRLMDELASEFESINDGENV